MTVITEEEARKNRCCNPYPCGVPDDRGVVKSVQRLCIGSDCMGWRWWKTNLLLADMSEYDRKLSSHVSTNDLAPASRTMGFCGLAGEPK